MASAANGEAATECPVRAYTEWDPLEEVVVGRLEGAVFPPHHVTLDAAAPSEVAARIRETGGRPYPEELVRAAQAELDELIRILEGEGVAVRRPDPVEDFSKPYSTPDWSSSGFCVACPRDGFMVIGDEIIETPMSWRSRYFEGFPYRSLFLDYFRRGARWTSAPKPRLLDSLYDQDYVVPERGAPVHYVIDESEIVFDAADFVRCGRDLFVAPSNVTNRLGIEWLRRHLGDGFRIHEIEARDRKPMHIDATFMPLAPGKVLVNPERIVPEKLPSLLRTWDVLVAPRPDPSEVAARLQGFSMTSQWINMNVLMLDEKRVLVDRSQGSMIRALRDWGFEPIACAFLHYAPFGGSFHCATLDVRRRGELRSYF